MHQSEYDLVLLDINLPDGSGYDLCRLIKPENPDTLVIFLTANDQESDQIRGYEVGAVDYITKPFSIGALLRKIRAMFAMLEQRGLAKDFYDDGTLFLDFSEQSAVLNGRSLTLSPMEYKMLSLFCKNPKQILTRQRLLERLWDADENYVDEHTLTTCISRIRGKIEADVHSILLSTSYQKHHTDMDVGATMDLILGQETVTVTISGLFDASKTANGHGTLAMDSAALFAPEELFLELHPEIESFDYLWSIVSDPKKAESVESRLKELVSGRSNLGMDTIATHIEYEKMQSSIIFGSLQALSWLIFLFGVVNLINTTLSNQMSRKRENSILRSVGLTGKQLCRMSVTEGMCHGLFAALTVLILGLPLSIAVCAEVSKKSFAGAVVPYEFPFLQMGMFLLVLFGMEVILSVWMVRRQKKQSLVEQMRAQG